MISARAFRRLRRISVFLLITTSLTALAAGYSFIVDPDGSGLRISVDYLRYTPFESFLIPGIVLFTVVGTGCLVTAVAVIRKIKFYHLLMILEGILLGGWIVVQSFMLREFNLLHFVFIVTGAFLLITGLIFYRQMKSA